ncbi:MAG TPA: phenylalanine--tRNA ligase beta subunit-related protein [Vicinamibacteria bacterium]|nr:phenylalanine--tRNA ligase beta subunit-related protein [Vicinamibacteria bacterium]
MSAIELAVAPELAGRVRLGVLVLDGVAVRASDPALIAEVDAYCAELATRHAGVSSGSVPGIEEARGLYKALGIDPTKTRPSNEALLRRALKGEALYRINTLVDALNLASLRAQLPFGLYDRGKVEAPVTLRRGQPGESYEGIRKGPVSVEGRPVLVDARGPFGNPTSDSARTCITLQTTSTLVVAYAPAGYSDRRLGEVLDEAEALLTRYCGGTRA